MPTAKSYASSLDQSETASIKAVISHHLTHEVCLMACATLKLDMDPAKFRDVVINSAIEAAARKLEAQAALFRSEKIRE